MITKKTVFSVLGILGFVISGILGANMIISKKKDK